MWFAHLKNAIRRRWSALYFDVLGCWREAWKSPSRPAAVHDDQRALIFKLYGEIGQLQSQLAGLGNVGPCLRPTAERICLGSMMTICKLQLASDRQCPCADGAPLGVDCRFVGPPQLIDALCLATRLEKKSVIERDVVRPGICRGVLTALNAPVTAVSG